MEEVGTLIAMMIPAGVMCGGILVSAAIVWIAEKLFPNWKLFDLPIPQWEEEDDEVW